MQLADMGQVMEWDEDKDTYIRNDLIINFLLQHEEVNGRKIGGSTFILLQHLKLSFNCISTF